MIKYVIQAAYTDGKEIPYPEVIEQEDLSLSLGEHQLFYWILSTPKGYKKITITSKIEKYP